MKKDREKLIGFSKSRKQFTLSNYKVGVVRKMQKGKKIIISFADLYPEPFLFLRSRTEIHAIDLLTHGKTVVIKGLQGRKMDYDTVTKKLYFQNGNNVSRANYDGSGVQMILQDLNATVYSMAIDWIGRRIFWTVDSPRSGIFVAKLDGKEKRMLVLNTSIVEPLAIAVDPNEG